MYDARFILTKELVASVFRCILATRLLYFNVQFLASNVANSVEGLASLKPSVAMVDGNILKDGVVVKENYARYFGDDVFAL